MKYVVTIEDGHYNRLKFEFEDAEHAVGFMHTCISANSKIKATLEIENICEEVSKDE